MEPTSNEMEERRRRTRHSVRGTLHALKLCVDALQYATAPDEAEEFLRDIDQSAERLGQLMDDVDRDLCDADG